MKRAALLLSLLVAACGGGRDDLVRVMRQDLPITVEATGFLQAVYRVDDFDSAVQRVRGDCEIAALTRSEKGSVVVAGDEVHVIDAAPVASVVDTTGTGDAYAAGFLYGLSHGWRIDQCARLGGLAAAEVIGHIGARPEADLAALRSDSFG